MRADSGFFSAKTVKACRRHQLRYSITVRQTKPVRAATAAIDEQAWVDIVYPEGGVAQVAETRYKGDRLVVRRTRLVGAQAELFPNWRYHAFVTDRVGTAAWLDADHRRHATVELCIRDLKAGVGLRHFPLGKFAANAAWLVAATLAHNLLRWVAANAAWLVIAHPGAQPAALDRRHRPGRPRGAGGRQDAAPDPAGPARPRHPLRPTMEAAPARRLAVGGVVRAGAGAAALHRRRHLTGPAAQRNSQGRPVSASLSKGGQRAACSLQIASDQPARLPDEPVSAQSSLFPPARQHSSPPRIPTRWIQA